MAAGEQKWSSRGQTVKRFSNEPIPKGTYPAELLADGMGVKLSASDPENSIPRIGVRFVMQGTAKAEGQKDRLFFHDFYLSTKPGKDGIAMLNRGGQLVEFARANGDEMDDIELEEKTITNAQGEEETVRYLSPTKVMEYLESKVGTVNELKLTIEPDTAQADEPVKGIKKGDKYPLGDEHPGRNKAQNFVVSEAAMQQASVANDDAEDVEVPAKVTSLPTKSKAPAPKVAAKPVAKVAGKKR